jgi:putative hydrolase of HD superfamily
MKNGKFTNTIIRMQYLPRWSEYAPRFKDNIASHSFRCAAIAILIAIIEEKVNHNPINKLSLFGRSLLHKVNVTSVGSLKYMTKKHSLVIDHISELEREANLEIVSYLSNSLRPFFHDYIVEAEDNSHIGKLVKEIDAFSSMLFCHREDITDSSPFFREQYDQFHLRLQSSELPATIWLLEEFDKREGVYEFLNYITNLDIIERWSGIHNLVPDNDATHSFRVAALSLFNGLLERERFGKSDIDVYRLVAKAALHDMSEFIGGDPSSLLKGKSHEINHAFKLYEKEIAMQMVHKLPAFFHEELIDFMVNSKDETYEGELLDIADKIDALIKSNLEMRNNPHYADTYYMQLTKIQHKYENPCVIFFLAYILHDLTYANLIK